MQNDYVVSEHLTVGYRKQPLIEDINLHIKKGEILTLIGPNGVGKSTILKSIIRQLPLLGGTVFFDGADMQSLGAKVLAEKLAIVMTDRIHPERYTCYDVVASGRYPYTGKMGVLQQHDKEIIMESMRQVHVEMLAEKDFNCISDGQRQRVMLARAICQEPEILVLDEPVSYLDIRYKTEFLWMLRKLVRKKHIAVVMSLHEIDLAQKISDLLVCVKNHQIDRIGKPEQILTTDYIKDLYGMEAGNYDMEYGSVEFPKVTGKPQVFVIGGGGSGTALYRVLQKKGVPCAAGILSEYDREYPVAKALCVNVIQTSGFSAPEEAILQEAKRQIDACETVYCAILEFGDYNLYNQELLRYAKDTNKLKNFKNLL